MDYLWFIGGVIFGSIVTNFLFYFRSKTGYLIKESDFVDGLSTFSIKLNGVLSNKTRKVILEIKDDVSHP